MKNVVSGLVTCVVIGAATASVTAAEPKTEPARTVVQFYEASQNGNLGAMRQLIDGSFQNRRKGLLNNGDSYSKFLVNYFRDAEIDVSEATVDHISGVASVPVTVTLQDKSTNATRLLLMLSESGVWKIVAEGNQ